MKRPNALLAAMGKTAEPEQVKTAASAALTEAKVTKSASAKRAGQKHLGAYFDKGDPILERVAILRARLDMTNSDLIEHALNELWARHEAKRKFGD